MQIDLWNCNEKELIEPGFMVQMSNNYEALIVVTSFINVKYSLTLNCRNALQYLETPPTSQ